MIQMLPMSLSEFRNLAWAAANEAAHQLGWIKGCDELRTGQQNGLDRVCSR